MKFIALAFPRGSHAAITCLAVAVLGALCLHTGTGAQSSFALIDLGTLGGGSSQAFAINDAGQVVGVSMTAGGAQHPFSWTATGGMIDLGTLSRRHGEAHAVNEAGQVVGFIYTDLGGSSIPSTPRASESDVRAFSWTAAGGMIDLGTLGGTFSSARAVNDAGQVVGFSQTAGGADHAFSWTGAGGMIDLGTLGGGFSTATAVNQAGQVIGFSQTAGGAERAFSWTATGGMIDLGTLGGDLSAPSAINDSGQVVGFSRTAGGADHAFSWTAADGMIDLGTLGGSSSGATAINDSGQVVGFSRTADGAEHAFSWTAAGGMIDLGAVGSLGGATAINDAGQVVGSTAFGALRAFSWTAASGMINLGSLGGDLSFPAALNESGQVVGSSSAGDGFMHAVLWRPASRPPALRVTTPNRPSSWGRDTRQRLAWTYHGNAPQFQIDISRNGGASWDFLSTVPNRAGAAQNFFWTVTGPSTTRARLRVTAIADEATDVNDADIRIARAAIAVLRPSATTVAEIGSRLTIFFTHNLGARKPIGIDVSGDGGGTWRTIAAHASTTGSTTSSFNWAVDLMPTGSGRARIRALDGSGAVATSPRFRVVAQSND
jgi:probable HAF family extracellular repeat protein